MITPDEIAVKLRNLYPAAISAWLSGDTSFFPKRIPADLSPKGLSQPDLIHQVAALRDASKERRGFGYTIVWEEINKRSHGENSYPVAIQIESLNDLVRATHKQTEFRVLEEALCRLRSEVPILGDWPGRYKKNWMKLIDVAGELEQLLNVVKFLKENPRPQCFIRELPLPVSTKVIERNRNLLREWLDMALPPDAIDWGCLTDFAQRYGFKFARPHLLLRLLDPSLKEELGIAWDELSLPSESLNELPVRDVQVFVVENKTNLLTLPFMRRGIALGGLGNNLSPLAQIGWLAEQSLHYWGDIDCEGLCILARFKHLFPNTRSMLMDFETLLKSSSLWTHWQTKVESEPPSLLSATESSAFVHCHQNHNRLEQEHIPQSFVNEYCNQL